MKNSVRSFRDETLPIETRLDLLMNELTIDEKIGQLPTVTKAIPRLGIQTFVFGSEAAHGVEARCDQDYNRGTPVETTIFPQPIGMSASWDEELLYQAGKVCGIEARAVDHIKHGMGLSRFAPTIDMERDPRWGRTEEGYGEDPFLTGKLASAYIRGMQGEDPVYLRCAATMKHFYGNNAETDRISTSSSIDVRNKMEYYLEPFRRAVEEGRAEAMMTAYNAVNGVPAICNMEVQKLVKDTWGLKGHVLCDAGDFIQNVENHHYCTNHARSLAQCIHAGVDAMTDHPEEVIKAANEALIKGYITKSDIDRAVRNSLRTRFRLGEFDEHPVCPYANIDETSIGLPEHKRICRKLGEEAMVLLKNENHTLPLINEYRTAAVIGPWANQWYKDWYGGVPEHGVTPYEGIIKKFGQENTRIADGLDRVLIHHGEQYVTVDEEQRLRLSDREHADIFIHTDWGWGQHTLVREKDGMFLSTDTKDGTVRACKTEAWGFVVKEIFHLVEEGDAFRLNSWQEESIGFGEDGVLMLNENSSDTFSMEVIVDGILEAVKAAREADVVIAALGPNPMINSKEEIDRKDLQFIPRQRELLQQVYKANPNTILLLITNYPYIIDWEQEHIPAILMTASGCQDLGDVAADALMGEFSPAGRLNMTWYANDEDLPDLSDYDIIRGKRTYQYFDGPVLYPFGYGLSYSEFEYSDFSVTEAGEKIQITLTVTNAGSCTADEVVQLYVTQTGSRAVRPIKQLKGFTRISLAPKESRRVTMNVPVCDLEYYDVVQGKMILEYGDYLFQAGASSQDIRCSQSVRIDGIKPGTRDLREFVPCDHYDDYQGVELRLGHVGLPALTPLHKLEAGTCVYRDAYFEFIPSRVLLDVKAETMGSVRILINGQETASQTFCGIEQFEVAELEADTTGLNLNEVVEITLELFGDVGITGFQFEA